MRRRLVTIGVVVASMAAGGVAGALVFGATSAGAQSNGSPGQNGTNPPASRPAWAWPGHVPGGPRFGFFERVSDLSVAAKAMGITEAQLVSSLRGGSSIAQVAKQHGVDVQKVISALVADAQSELAAAVKAGRITQSQADAIEAGLQARITDRVNAAGGMFHPPGFGPGFGFAPFGDLAVAAKAIGISPSALMAALRNGDSIAQVAKQHGVAVQDVVAALVADAKAKLAAAVEAGRITQSQANAIGADLQARITQRVNARGFDCGPGHPGRGFGAPNEAPDRGWGSAQGSA